MRTEIIVCQRCCLCIPLRYGLIVWGYARLVLAGLLLVGISYTLSRLMLIKYARTADIVISILIIILLIADIILGIVFIIGCHMKNAALIKKYYYHNLCLLALLLPFCLYVCGLSIYSMFKYKISIAHLVMYMISDLTGAITYVVIQIYVTLLVRSQFIKLNSGCQFRFENKVAEAECSMNIEDKAGEKSEDYKTTMDDFDEIGNFV